MATPGALLPETSTILGECDLVQFAKAPTEEARCVELLRDARGLVQRSQPTTFQTAAEPALGVPS